MNLPNTITLGRIFLVPLLVVVLLTRLDGWHPFGISSELIGAGIFAVASLTDWLDGYLARRRRQVTDMGQWMDPLADKLLVTAALISLVSLELAPAWMVAIILGRELSITVLRSRMHARGMTLPASPIGKVKMVAQVVAILALIVGNGQPSMMSQLGNLALWVATVAALVSGLDYYRRYSRLAPATPASRAGMPPAGVTPASVVPAAAPAPGGLAESDSASATRRISA